MNKFAVTIFAVLSIAMNIGYTQNLVRNPSFEVLTGTCNPDSFNIPQPFYLNTIWQTYFDPFSDSLATWNNFMVSSCYGNIVNQPHTPRTGGAFMVIGFYTITQNYSWDYNYPIAGLLTEKLIKDSTYCIGIYNQANFFTCITSDQLMMIVAPDSVRLNLQEYGVPESFYSVPDTSHVFSLKKYPHVQLPKNEFITSETEWTPIQGMITAQGGEKYFYFGNFTNAALLDTMTTPWSASMNFWFPARPNWFVYVNIDDAFVYARRPVFVKEGKVFELCEEEPFQPFTVHSDQAPEFIWYRAENPAQVLATRDSLYITSPGTYVVKGDACGYISYDTVTVRMKPCTVPPPNELLIPNILTPGADGINDTFVIQNLPPGSSFEFYNRWGNLLYKSENYQNDFTCGNCSGGVYFYVLRTNAGKLYKGQVTIVK